MGAGHCPWDQSVCNVYNRHGGVRLASCDAFPGKAISPMVLKQFILAGDPSIV